METVSPIAGLDSATINRSLMLRALTGASPSDGPDGWALESWEWCGANGLIDGTRPRDALTRQEFAVAAQRLRELIRKAP